MRKLYLFVTLMGALTVSSRAQFQVNGATALSSGSAAAQCFQLTGSDFHTKGAVWSTTKADLTKSFEINARLFFGSNEAGGDGIAFVMQNEGTSYTGNYGAGIGYHRFNGTNPSDWPADVPGPVPSFIVEFDTYQNGFIGNADIADPAADHVGFMSNSNAYHTSSSQLKAPQGLSANIEDGQWHDVRFAWNAITKTMTVTFTTTTLPLVTETFTYTGDIVNTIFGGTSQLYWGFTGSNGSFSPNVHQVCITVPGDCGQLRTQTPGGWGSKPAGNNPGTYLKNNFAAAFPSGLQIGGPVNYVKFTSAAAISGYLPAGGPSAKLTTSYTNPSTTSLKNTLVSHLIALTLSVRFDEVDPNFGAAGMQLRQMKIASGPFANWTVGDFLAEANKVLGGGTSAYTINQVLETASGINENYVDGSTDKNFLKCPVTTEPAPGPRRVAAPLVENVSLGSSVQPNPTRGVFQVQVGEGSGDAQVFITDANGNLVEKKSVTLNGTGQAIHFDLGRKASGLYLVRIVTKGGVQTQKVIVQH